MKWKSVLLLLAGSIVSLAVVTLSHAGRAQTGTTVEGPVEPGLVMQGGLPNLSPEAMRRVGAALTRMSSSVKFVKQGNIAADQGDWQAAKADYQQAQSLFPNYSEALYGLGQCADAEGDTAGAIRYYRRAIYSHDPNRYGTVPGDGYQTNDVERLMEYVLLLSKAGQNNEAVSVYRRAAGLLNYEDGRQNLDVLLPNFSPSGWAYTPKRLQAMAHIAIAYRKENFNDTLALSHLQQAVTLAPDSPLPYFYRARYWSHHREDKDAKADYAKAAQIGDAQIAVAAKKATASLP